MFQLGGADPPPAAPAPSSQSFSFPPDSPNPPGFLTPAVNRFHDYCTVNPINVFLVFSFPSSSSGLSSPLPLPSPSIVLPRQSGTVYLVVLSLTSGIFLTPVCCDAALSCGAVGGCDLGALLSRAWYRGVPPPKINRIGRKKKKNFNGKSRIWQKCRDFSLWDPPLDLLGLFMVVNYGQWMCSPVGQSQPRGYNLHQARGGFGLQSPWNESTE